MNETTPRQERRLRRQTENRETILHAAEAVIIRCGLSASTMDEIAREAGFSKATVYKYYPAKGDLVFAILIHYFEDIARAMNDIMASPAGAGEKLRRMLLTVLELHEKKENIARVIMLDRSIFRMMRLFMFEGGKPECGLEQEFLKRTKAELKKFEEILGGLISEGVRAGIFRPISVPELTTVVTSLVQGFGHSNAWSSRRRSPAENADIIHDFLIRGIGAPSKRAGKE